MCCLFLLTFILTSRQHNIGAPNKRKISTAIASEATRSKRLRDPEKGKQQAKDKDVQATGPDQYNRPTELDPAIVKWVRSAKTIAEWKNMVYVFWGQYNFVYRGETTDRRTALFTVLLPDNLSAYDEELSEHFDNVWGRYNEFFHKRIKFYGDWFHDKTKELMAPLARI